MEGTAPQVDETRHPDEPPVAYAQRVARDKAQAAPRGELPVVAADTVVHLGHRVYGKPADRQEARQILETLSGQWHQVTTGVCVGFRDQWSTFAVTTRVRFRTLSIAEIEAYLDTPEPYDKAGAYGIQGRAGAFVAQVDGSWTNVMGLPMEATLASSAERESG